MDNIELYCDSCKCLCNVEIYQDDLDCFQFVVYCDNNKCEKYLEQQQY